MIDLGTILQTITPEMLAPCPNCKSQYDLYLIEEPSIRKIKIGSDLVQVSSPQYTIVCENCGCSNQSNSLSSLVKKWNICRRNENDCI